MQDQSRKINDPVEELEAIADALKLLQEGAGE